MGAESKPYTSIHWKTFPNDMHIDSSQESMKTIHEKSFMNKAIATTTCIIGIHFSVSRPQQGVLSHYTKVANIQARHERVTANVHQARPRAANGRLTARTNR
ncbi:hypothetical protein M8818_006426 [Zalaria obscura]|uniref:Uncharacterized protein n=1 Tax=Zalaria obscura TaxID=2024903 RepID=A0ACC3S5X3_9PEZI